MALKSIEIKELVKDPLYEATYLYNLYIVYKSIDNIDYLIYAKKLDILVFNLNLNIKQLNIKNAHNSEIVNFSHYRDLKSKRDLILTLSESDKNIKLWNGNTFECLYNFTNIFNEGHLYSACFLKDKDCIYIIASDFTLKRLKSSGIHIYDINGKLLNIINQSSGHWTAVCAIDTFYDDQLNKNYIITGNCGFCKSFDFEKNEEYKKYADSDGTGMGIVCCFNLFIYKSEGKIRLIDTNTLGNIRIWDFHSSDLLNKIHTKIYNLSAACLWNEQYFLFGGEKGTIEIYDLNKKENVNNLFISNEQKEIKNMKKIKHPLYGTSLIFFDGNSIKLSKIIEIDSK